MSQLTLIQINNGDTPDASILMTNLNTLKNRINLGMESDNISAGAVDGSHINLGAYIFKQSKGADVASAATVTLGNDGNFFDITGTTTITSITAKTAGTVVMLQFDGVLTVTNGSNLKLGSSMTTAANSTLALVSDGTNWYEIGRSPSLPAPSTSGNVLTSDGTNWASSAPAFSLVQSGTVTAQSSFTVSSLVAQGKYKFIFNGVQNTADAFLKLRCNADSGANYTWTDSGATNFGESTTEIRGYYSTYKVLTNGTIYYNFEFNSLSNFKAFFAGVLSFHYYSTDRLNTNFWAGRYTGAAALSSINISCDAGTMTGSWYLYKLS